MKACQDQRNLFPRSHKENIKNIRKRKRRNIRTGKGRGSTRRRKRDTKKRKKKKKMIFVEVTLIFLKMLLKKLPVIRKMSKV